MVEYKKESFELFKNLMDKIRQDTLVLLLNLRIAEDAIKPKSSEKIIDKNKKKLVEMNYASVVQIKNISIVAVLYLKYN